MVEIKRRTLLELGGIVGAGAAASLAWPRQAGARELPFEEYARHDALGLAELVVRREVGPLELLEAAIARAETVDPTLNAIAARHDDLARQAIERGLPDGPLRGVPFLLKDHLSLAGTISTQGSVFFRDAVAAQDSTIVTRYRRAGLVIFGKTAMPEFGASPSTESRLFGATRNPWNLAHSAGGSSGGSAAAVAAGVLPIANGSDGGGSIRIPASCCGLFGMKPTRVRTPWGPEKSERRNGMTVIHALSRSVRDCAALLDASAGPELGDPYWAPPQARPFLEEVTTAPGALRVALVRRPMSGIAVHEECLKAVDDAAKLCESLGHHVEEAAPELPVREIYQGINVTAKVMTQVTVEDREAELGRAVSEADLEPLNWASLQQGRKMSGADDARARQAFHRASRLMARFQRDFDVILSPTMAAPPPEIGVLSLSGDPETFIEAATSASAFTILYNVTGQPAMTLPLHWTPGGLPIGVMFAGRFGDEATLYRLAGQIERASPWAGRRPASVPS